MKKKNGFTMTELMFSIVIIAIIMVFLVNLLIDINYDKRNELYDTANNYNRAEIIKKVQSDFVSSKLKNAECQDSGIKLTNANNVITTIGYSRDYITYKDNKWPLKTNNNETYIYTADKARCNNYFLSCKHKNNDYIITIRIPIIIDNSKAPIMDNGELIFRDNRMDDIILTFYTNEYSGSCI